MSSLYITFEKARYFQISKKRKSPIKGCRKCNIAYKKVYHFFRWCYIFINDLLTLTTGSSPLAPTIISYKLKIKFKHNWGNLVSKKYGCLPTANTRAGELTLLVHENTVEKSFKFTIHCGFDIVWELSKTDV